MIEPSDSFITSNKGMVARTLVKANEQVPIRCANFSDEPHILYPGTNIAEFSPVQVIVEAKTTKAHTSTKSPKTFDRII